MPTPICSITQVARRLGLSVRMIRTYETEGFISFERISGRCYLRPEDIEVVWKDGRLLSIPGVGEGLGKKIDEFLRTGRMSKYEEITGDQTCL